MDLLRILWPSKKISRLFALISLLVTLVLSWPIVRYPSNPFYSVDPDVPYLTNSLELIVTGRVSFINHPGTPLQSSTAFSFWPMRIWAKLIDRTPFVEWSLKNFTLVAWYARFFMAVIFTVSIYLLLSAWYSLSGSPLPAIIGLLSLGLFEFSAHLPFSIRAEGMILLLFSIWVTLLALLLKSNKTSVLLPISFITGLLMATKYTTVFLIPITLLIAIFQTYTTRKNHNKSAFIIMITILALLFGFVFGTWPIRDKYPRLINWGATLLLHPEPYGGGEKKLFDIKTYTKSTKILVKSNKFPYLLMSTSIILLILHKQKNKVLFICMAVVATVGILVFFKYPMDYYQIANYLILITLLTVSFSTLSPRILTVVCASILLSISINLPTKLKNTRKQVIEAVNLENFILDHPPRKTILWEYGRSKDFSLLWGRVWAGGFYTQQMAKLFPYLYDVHDHKTVSGHYGEDIPIEKFCWANLYIQRVSYPSFILYNPQYSNTSHLAIPGTEMIFLERPECF